MKYKQTIYTLVLMGVSLTMPALVPANGLQYSEGNRNASSSFILKVQSTERWETDRPDLGGKGIYSYGSELFNEPKLFRESQDKSSETGIKSDSGSPAPSVDIPDSVDGHSRRANPWWDRRSSADPMVEDLSRMDSGFSGPGSSGSTLGR
jgi:hypothetical protein